MLIDGTQRRQNEQENTMLTGGQQGSGMSTSMAANPRAGQTTQAGTPTKSGSWTNLSQYLDKNQSNATQTANRIGQATQQVASGAQAKLGEAATAGQQAQNQLQEIAGNQEFIQSAFEDPTQFVQNQSNLERFRGLRDTMNADPADTINQFNTTATQAATEAGRAAQRLKQLQTQGGLTNELRSIRQTPRYSAGSQALDRFLLTGTEPGKQAIQSAVQQGEQIAGDTRLQDLANSMNQVAGGLNTNLLTADQIKNLGLQRQNEFQSGLMGQLTPEQVQARALEQFYGGDQQKFQTAQEKANIYRQDQQNLQGMMDEVSNVNRAIQDVQRQLQGRVPMGIEYNQLQNQLNELLFAQQFAQGSLNAAQGRIQDFQTNYQSAYDPYQQYVTSPTAERALASNDVAKLKALAQLSGLSVDDFLGARI